MEITFNLENQEVFKQIYDFLDFDIIRNVYISGSPEENVGGGGGGGSASRVADDFNGLNLFHRFLGEGGVINGGLQNTTIDLDSILDVIIIFRYRNT